MAEGTKHQLGGGRFTIAYCIAALGMLQKR